MTQQLTAAPLAFVVPEPDEAEIFQALNAAMRPILAGISEDYGHAVRAVHAESHGLLTGEVEALGDLPPELAQGVFAPSGTLPAVKRLDRGRTRMRSAARAA